MLPTLRTPSYIMRSPKARGDCVRKDGNVDVSIGGILENGVGFLYCPENSPPGIDPSSFIWIERVADKWYLYRTT